MRVYLEGIGLCGPGLAGWQDSADILGHARAYQPTSTVIPPSPLLPPNERCRAVQTVKIALAVGAEAFTAAGRDAADAATIFASSGGDGDTIDSIMQVLASSDIQISPTRFHNSVHNAPAGYWSIATGSQGPSSSLCCHDDSFAAGLLEAAVQAVTDKRPVALIAYDVCYPIPLSMVRAIGAAFAVALVLTPAPSRAAFASLDIALIDKATASIMADPELESLRKSTPAARSLPLLATLAGGGLATNDQANTILAYLDDMALSVQIQHL